MNRRVVGFALLAAVVLAGTVYFALQTITRRVPRADTPKPLKIQLPLDPTELVWLAAAGNLTNSLPIAELVFGTTPGRPRGHPRIHILHWQKDHYEQVWTYTSDYDRLASLMVRSTHAPFLRDDLIALWDSGSGHFLGAQIFEWDGRTYKEIWNLDYFARNGQQFLMGAWFDIRRIEPEGDLGLVIRAPIVKSYETRHDALQHQVSIYRWDARTHTFVLFKRFLDPAKTFE